jgi:hypothetical protein
MKLPTKTFSAILKGFKTRNAYLIPLPSSSFFDFNSNSKPISLNFRQPSSKIQPPSLGSISCQGSLHQVCKSTHSSFNPFMFKVNLLKFVVLFFKKFLVYLSVLVVL